MQTYLVYHAKNPTFGFGKDPSFPDEYDMVATVNAEDLEDVFRITNHIDSDWTRNPEVTGVTSATKNGCRSTSVGDVVEEDATGKLFYCDHAGWKDITDYTQPAPTH